MKISGTVALVTGGALGLGAAICEALLQKEAKGVCIVDISEEKGLETEALLKDRYGGERVFFVQGDIGLQISLEGAFKQCLARFGQLDIVGNNAGIMYETNWEHMLNVNLSGTIRGTLLGVEYMSKLNGHNGGVIVNTGSILGLVEFGNIPVYSASKWGIVGFTLGCSARQSYAGSGIRFNCLCPSTLDTPMARTFTKEHIGPDYQLHVDACETLTYLPASKVAESFIRLVEDDTLKGKTLMVTAVREPEFISPPVNLSDYA